MKKYLKMIGFMLLYSAVYLSLLMTLSKLYFNVLSKVPFFERWIVIGMDNGMPRMNFPLFHLFSDSVILPCLILVYALLKKQNLFKAVRFNYKNLSLQGIGIISVLCLFASLFTASLMKLPWAKDSLPGIHMLLNTRLLDQHIIQFIIWLPLHCAIFREVLLRGIVYNEFKAVMPLTMALIMQGLMQGLYFFQFGKVDLVVYGLLSCVFFALIYEWTDSLWASIIAQLFIETFLFIWKNTGYFFFTSVTSGLIMGASIIVLAGGLLYLREYELGRRKKVEADMT